MGSDLIAKANDMFARKQRRCMDQLDDIGLFTGFAQLSVGLVATPNDEQSFVRDKRYRLAMHEGLLVVVDGVSIVGVVEDPPRSVVDLLSGACPSALARVVKLYDLTSKADLELVE